jgi:hypothetical protein
MLLRTKLFTAIAITSGLANAAHAVFLNPHGTGEALVYPYYTVNAGNSTLLSITNSTSAGKAIKVRFLESQDERDVLDFNVYLSPFDMWVAQVIDKGGGAAIFTNDNSCTIPQIPKTATTALAFSTSSFDDSTPQFTDGGPTDISRTLEGSIEIIEMGNVTNATQNTLTAITHVNGVPQNCAQIANAWTGYWQTEPTTDLSPATGGLFGSGTILNLALGTVQMYNADALGEFYTPDTIPLHTAHDALTPNLSTGTSKSSVTFVDDNAITTPFDKSIDAVSSVFMADSVMNEFWTSSSIGASSEWVLMFPTKRFYTDPQYAGYLTTTAIKPFDLVFGSTDDGAGHFNSCTVMREILFDREEAHSHVASGDEPEHLPPLPCIATQVIAFGQPAGHASKILGSILAIGTTPSPSPDGMAQLNLVNNSHTLTGSNGNIFYGLPVTGFWANQLVNGNIAGALANFTALSPHKVHVTCNRGDTTQPCS